MSRRTYLAYIICIGAIAFTLRATAPFPRDVLGDEATYAFRSVGYFDHLASQLQTTPYQWFETPPWWAKLSFHDHPPFAFMVYHLAFKAGGMHTSILRLIPLITGVATVMLTASITANLGGRRAGIIAGALAAGTSGLLWISQVALLENVMLPLMLAAYYASQRAREQARWWLPVGVFFGLALLTKYTAVFILPALATTAWYCCRPSLARENNSSAVRANQALSLNRAIPVNRTTGKHAKSITGGSILVLLLLMPVFVYNLKLIQTRGHPDYQFSRLLHINTPDWREDFMRRRPFQGTQLIMTVRDNVSWPGFVLLSAALAWLGVYWWKYRSQNEGVLLINIASLSIGAAWMGSDARFVLPLLPYLCIAGGLAIEQSTAAIPRTIPRRLVGISISILFIAACIYSVNTHLLPNPWGKEGVTYAAPRQRNYGYEQLDAYLLELYRIRGSSNDLEEEKEGKTLYMYDSNMDYFPRLWYIQRRVTYQGIPFTSTQEFKKLIEQHGEEYFPSLNFSKFVFIHALPGTLLVPEDIRDTIGDGMAVTLAQQGLIPSVITRADGMPAFEIYEF